MFKTIPSNSLKMTVLDKAYFVAKNKGISNVRMRELASECKCAVGTLYNLFENFDEIHYHLNLRTFKMLFGKIYAELKELSEKGLDLEEILPKLGWAYIEFGKAYFHLWSALFENTPKSKSPSWYRAEIVASFEKIEQFLAIQFSLTKEKASKIANYFWFAIHGVSSIILHKRATNQSEDFLNSYIEHCLRGIYALA